MCDTRPRQGGSKPRALSSAASPLARGDRREFAAPTLQRRDRSDPARPARLRLCRARALVAALFDALVQPAPPTVVDFALRPRSHGRAGAAAGRRPRLRTGPGARARAARATVHDVLYSQQLRGRPANPKCKGTVSLRRARRRPLAPVSAADAGAAARCAAGRGCACRRKACERAAGELVPIVHCREGAVHICCCTRAAVMANCSVAERRRSDREACLPRRTAEYAPPCGTLRATTTRRRTHKRLHLCAAPTRGAAALRPAACPGPTGRA